MHTVLRIHGYDVHCADSQGRVFVKLEHLMKLSIRLGEGISIGAMGRGVRNIGVVADGSFQGEKLRGEVVGPGADWVVMNDRGWGELDVRIALQTDDGDNIYMHYTGVLEFNEAIGAAFAGSGETAIGDNYFVTQPRFETGSEQYAWLNWVVAIAEGRATADGVEYEVYACQPG